MNLRVTLPLFILLFLSGFALRYYGTKSRTQASLTQPVEGPEIQAVFLASPSCKFCRTAEYASLMNRVLDTLDAREERTGRRISSIFVGISDDQMDAVQLANDLGVFDEIIAGHGWINSGAMRYLWNDLPSEAATPGLVVTKRIIRIDSIRGRIETSPETLLLRLVGLDELRRWVTNGMPVPALN